MQIHLMHVFSGVPESYWDLEREPAAISNIPELHAWESQHRTAIEKHMQTCREILLAHDVHPKNIHVNISKRKVGVARDIMNEARKGYAALVLRRRGMTRLQKLIMGSTAQKLLNGMHDVPLIFASRKPHSPRVLLAFDGSENAFRAVDFTCSMLMPAHHSVILASILRADMHEETIESGATAVKDHLQSDLDLVSRRVDQAVARFHACGFSQDAVQSRIISDSFSRAASILDLAAKEDCNTIVVGRKGYSKVQDFTVGRVSQKILQLGASYTVWIVS
jgi:nucleotide-binding universal stress UspA family protein